MRPKEHDEKVELDEPPEKSKPLTPAEQEMKRMHEEKCRRMAEAFAAGINAAVKAEK